MLDYQIQPNSRRCAATGRELKPGERYYSVLLEEADKLVRRDYSREAWQGPPEGAFGHWMGKVSRSQKGQTVRPTFNDDLLLDCFTRLEGRPEPARINFRYVLALLLMRRKRLKFEETLGASAGGQTSRLKLRCAQTRAVHEVIDPHLSEEEILEVQEEVFKLLGWA